MLLGRIPPASVFAGRKLNYEIDGGNLLKCVDCGFVFRSPLLPLDVYDELYRKGTGGLWEHDVSGRKDFALVMAYLRQKAFAATVVDLGCFTGQLLGGLPCYLQKFGVEINEEARAVASERGVSLVAQSLEEFASLDRKFDFITACDLIEHVANPLNFLKLVRDKLTPDGTALITTGNPDVWLWRIFKARYWYCYYPEHISFVSPTWFKNMVGKADLKVEKVQQFNYGIQRECAWILYPFICLATAFYAASPTAYLKANNLLGLRKQKVPGRGLISDHVLYVLKPA